MKLFKIIISCVVVLFLLISVALNIFQRTNAFEHTEETPVVEVAQAKLTEKVVTESAAEIITIPDVIPELPMPSIEDCEEAREEVYEEPFYQDDYIKVTYNQSEEKAYGSVHKFKIENLSNTELTVLFTDVYINGELVFTSGLTCEHLQSGAVEVEEFVLVPNDGEPISIYANVSFKVKLVNAKSYFDIYESEQIAFDMEEVI